MRDNQSFWLGRCSGSEDDLQGVRSIHVDHVVGGGGMPCDFADIIENNAWRAGNFVQMWRGTHQHLRAYLLVHAAGKIGRGGIVHGNCDRATQSATKECPHPFRAVLTP